MPNPCRLIICFVVVSILTASCSPVLDQPSTQVSSITAAAASTSTLPVRSATSAPSSTPPSSEPAAAAAINFDSEDFSNLVSEDSLLGYLAELTSIRPYSGWRNGGSRGEAEALDYVERTLNAFTGLKDRGLELERQTFNIFMSTNIWDTSLSVTIDNQEFEIPAEGMRGSRHFRRTTAYFDSDGLIADTEPDPLTGAGASLVLLNAEQLQALTAEETEGKVLFIDYSLLDSYTNPETAENVGYFIRLVDQGLAGVVFITQYSNSPAVSRGTQMAEAIDFNLGVPARRVPFLFIRIEDLSPVGINDWADLGEIQSARLMLDADVLSAGSSGNLVARIPGADQTHAVILSAHIDSPNTPGAFDDGSGSAALLEIARVLDAGSAAPPVDMYLVWHGSHEICTCGSAHFANTHQDLLDRTLALINMDGLGYPLENRPSTITAVTTTYERFGEEHFPLFDVFSETAAALNIDFYPEAIYGPSADNSNFDAFDVPNVNLYYLNPKENQIQGWSYMHYSNHWHDPYETVDLAREVGDVFVGMTRLMLKTALEIGAAQAELRVTPPKNKRALLVATHTEPDNVPTSMLRELGMALAWEGYDVDLLPYGQAVTAADLGSSDIVVLPPTLDFPGQVSEPWSETEFGLLEDYVAQGGFLVVTNSACNYAMKRCLEGLNEDTRVLNPLLEPMGLKFSLGLGLDGELALASGDHPLTEGATYLKFYPGEGVAFRTEKGLVLLEAGYRPIVALLDYGNLGGQVLVIADLGLLQADSLVGKNHQFMQNIAHYASIRKTLQ